MSNQWVFFIVGAEYGGGKRRRERGSTPVSFPSNSTNSTRGFLMALDTFWAPPPDQTGDKAEILPGPRTPQPRGGGPQLTTPRGVCRERLSPIEFTSAHVNLSKSAGGGIRRLGQEAGGSQLAVGLDWFGGKVVDGEKRLNERHPVCFFESWKTRFDPGSSYFRFALTLKIHPS